jgi:ubiquinone biosynthesis protein UbiJ
MLGEERLLRAVDVAGNARLASEVMFLFRHLRWDAEEEAAKLIGDVAAHRLAGMARGVAAWHADAARRIARAWSNTRPRRSGCSCNAASSKASPPRMRACATAWSAWKSASSRLQAR